MYCNRCGERFKESDKFCSRCGTPINNSQEQYNYGFNSTTITDDDLISAYIGNNYNDIKNSKFSIPTFFLGVYYFLYRKMWLYAILGFSISVICTVLSVVFNIWYVSLVTFIYIIFMALNVNNLYINIARKRVEKIKKNNPNKTNQELINECKKKGGTSVLGVILPIIIIFPILFIAFFIFIFVILMDEFDSKYDNKSSELRYQLPEVFKDNDNRYNSDTYSSYYYNDSFDSCNISISNYTTFGNKTAEEYLKEDVTSNMNEEVSIVNTKNINNFEWKFVEVKGVFEKTYYYTSIFNNRVYKIKYKITKDDSKLCSNGYETFINSLSFKLNNIDNINTI